MPRLLRLRAVSGCCSPGPPAVSPAHVQNRTVPPIVTNHVKVEAHLIAQRSGKYSSSNGHVPSQTQSLRSATERSRSQRVLLRSIFIGSFGPCGQSRSKPGAALGYRPKKRAQRERASSIVCVCACVRGERVALRMSGFLCVGSSMSTVREGWRITFVGSTSIEEMVTDCHQPGSSIYPSNPSCSPAPGENIGLLTDQVSDRNLVCALPNHLPAIGVRRWGGRDRSRLAAPRRRAWR